MQIHLPATHTTIHVTTLLIVICAALCAERLLLAYHTRKLGRRRGRMWLPYAAFGLLGLAVLALQPPAYSVLAAHTHPRNRSGYTHAGFAGPTAEAATDLFPAKRKRQRLSPLAEYHLPHGAVDDRAR